MTVRDSTLEVASFVALGDSFTEGLEDDLGPYGRHRGWADRVAWTLAEHAADGFRYANLAVRGRLIGEVSRNQVPAAADLRPDLVSFHAGGNDLLRPGVDPVLVLARYEEAVARLRAAGTEVLVFTVLERAGGTGRLADRLAARFAVFNAGVREVAARHGARLVDVGVVPALHDRRLWAEDRLHLNPEGHRRVAAAVLETLGVRTPDPGWWRQPLPPEPPQPRTTKLAADLRWIRRHLLPWVGRRIRGVSSGDDVVCKRPTLEPLI